MLCWKKLGAPGLPAPFNADWQACQACSKLDHIKRARLAGMKSWIALGSADCQLSIPAASILLEVLTVNVQLMHAFTANVQMLRAFTADVCLAVMAVQRENALVHGLSRMQSYFALRKFQMLQHIRMQSTPYT